MGTKNYITPKGFERLQAELHQLLRIERPEVTKLVQWAASNGDRSENADYLYGKKRLREIDRRVRFLTQRIEAAVVVDPGQIKSDKIQFGAQVELLDEEGVTKRFVIVGVDEVDTAKGRISWQSPIGRSLLGKAEGDEVTVIIPSGETSFEVVKVDYQPIE
jgi:transcription elongation factor GreB